MIFSTISALKGKINSARIGVKREDFSDPTEIWLETKVSKNDLL